MRYNWGANWGEHFTCAPRAGVSEGGNDRVLGFPGSSPLGFMLLTSFPFGSPLLRSTNPIPDAHHVGKRTQNEPNEPIEKPRFYAAKAV